MKDGQQTMPEVSVAQRAVNKIWPYVTGRRGWILFGLTAIGGGLAMNWGTVVALGLAPLLLGVLPCVAMCALGMCMSGGSGQCSSKTEEKGKADDV
ncbi:MAG: hypothetical protein RIC85_02870 [Gammaproteobacteria bacterium]|nr:hypothetical protein [Alphaproteobacteria bacterium LMO-S08]WND75140.1 hypothetical protein RJ527_13995 [Thalassospiraceae bacterium LMO-SO8]|tara:strand:+ start:983 stop:1270 length:288 start_codon:yes stop_codon:yes gene_type:complete